MLRLGTQNTDLIPKTWDYKLAKDTQVADPLIPSITGPYKDKQKAIPNDAIMEVKAPAGKRIHTIGLVKDLNDAPTEGRDSLLGSEEDQDVLQLTTYAHEVKHGVNSERYGVDKIDKDNYDLLRKIQPQLSKWHGEIEGKYAREAFCELYSSNLEKAPVSLTQGINKNFYFAGVATASQPAYDSTLADYVTNIDSAKPGAGATYNANLVNLNALGTYAAVDKQIEPLVINGRDYYVLTIPSPQAKNLRDPSVTNSLAALSKDADIRGENNRLFSGLIGVFQNLILIEDPRWAKVTVNTTVTFNYRLAGGTDNRPAAAATVYDVGMLLGKGALCKLVTEELHFENEYQDYDKIVGVGAFTSYGYTLREYDYDSGSQTDSSRFNKSSILVAFNSSGL